MSSYAGTDDCTDVILDFIAGGRWGNELGNPVGESNGNYNAYFGHADSTRELAAMTLAAIYQFQDEMLEEDPRSTAIGRYQFLKGTLQGLQTAAGIADDTLFSMTLQDHFAVELLRRRGYEHWWNGVLSDEGFAHELSCEWASLPDPENGGKSHYDGDSAGNHASTTLDHVYEMLRLARTKKPAVQQPAKPAPPPALASATDAIKSVQAMLLHRGLLKQPDGRPATPAWIDGEWGKQSQLALNALAQQAHEEN